MPRSRGSSMGFALAEQCSWATVTLRALHCELHDWLWARHKPL